MSSVPRLKNLGALPYKEWLTQYHQDLMKVFREHAKAKNSERGQKNQTAQSGGMDYSQIIADFEEKHGHFFRDTSN